MDRDGINLMRVLMITINDDRFSATHKHLSEMTKGLTIHRVRGVVGSTMTPKQCADACGSSIIRPWLTPSMLGCGSSHLRALRYFLDYLPDDNHIMIVEDDARLEEPFDYADMLVDEMMKKRMDLLNLGGLSARSSHQMICQSTEDLGQIVPVWLWLSTTGYIVSRRGARAILHHLDHGGILYHIDVMYHMLIRKGLVRAGIIRDPIIFQHEENHMTSTNASITDSWSDQACRLMSPDLQFAVSMSLMRVPHTGITIKLSMIIDVLVAIIIPQRAAVFYIALLIMGRNRWWALFLVFVLGTIILYDKPARRFWALMIAMTMIIMTMILALASRIAGPRLKSFR